MNSVFLRRTGRFGAGLYISFLICFALIPFVGKAAMSSANFNGSVTSPPQVDATNFINSGTWNISTTPLPYMTSHTLNYTNTGGGSMTGSVGWEFDYGTGSGGRSWSANFFNDNNSTISASDGLAAILFSYETVSYLLVSATNIVNKGTLSAGPNGEIILNGSEVSLNRSSLEITPIVGMGSSFGPTNDFVSDTAIYDEYWQGAANNKLQVDGSPWDGVNVDDFTFINVGEPCGTIGTESIGEPFPPQVADSFATNVAPYQLTLTNSTGATNTITVYSNIVRQAVFVFTSDTNITATNHFSSGFNVNSNSFQIVAVRLLTVSTNLITLTLQTNTLYLIDDLATSTNRALITNSVIHASAPCTSPTFRPSSVIVSRTDPTLPVGFLGSPAPVFASGSPGNGPPTNTFFYGPTKTNGLPAFEMSEMFSNVTAAGVADLYSALVDDLAYEPVSGTDISNAPGKIHIYAKDLDLTKTHMVAQSQIVIQASNLISSAGAILDCQNLSYNLGSTNGFLNITNLAVSSVKRLKGTIDEWTGLWTNSLVTIYTNYMLVVTTTSTNYVLSPLTNTTEMDFSMTVVDASGLSSSVPVTVQDLDLKSTNMVVSDSMDVTGTLLFNGQSLTLLGNLTLSGALQNWGAANAPTLRYFTNYGALNIPNNAHFGDDTPTNYAAFVNHGTIYSGGQTINSDYLEINGGTNSAQSADFTASCKTGLVMNSSIEANGDIVFYANNLVIDPSVLECGGALDFTVTNSLSDAGLPPGSPPNVNTFTCENGFNLFIKPATGGLMGTTIYDVAFGQDEVDHVWAGTDLGATTNGYLNNTAIGTLILYPIPSPFEPLFYFKGATTGNGLYVSNLDLSMLTDYTNEIDIDSSLNIYFASAEVNGLGHPLAEQLLNNHQFPSGGHLYWVTNVTSLPLITKGDTYSKKFQLMTGGNNPSGQFQLMENILPAQTNITEASTDLVHWLPIYTNIGSYSNFGPTTIVDPAATNYPFRFYRFKVLQ